MNYAKKIAKFFELFRKLPKGRKKSKHNLN